MSTMRALLDGDYLAMAEQTAAGITQGASTMAQAMHKAIADRMKQDGQGGQNHRDSHNGQGQAQNNGREAQQRQARTNGRTPNAPAR
ncbi:MAG: hypothetical protein M0Z67_04235 [Nitrospiraceae bacterium]|nr:hypothetical protein [Nitrospiraceae bacterium]